MIKIICTNGQEFEAETILGVRLAVIVFVAPGGTTETVEVDKVKQLDPAPTEAFTSL